MMKYLLKSWNRAPLFISSWTYICNTSLSSGIFRIRLKFSIVKSVFKNGERFDISNCRLIFLLTSFSKVLEKVIYTRLHQHISQNNILVNEEYGFRCNSATKYASYKLINYCFIYKWSA
jgi:hypothetical protein